MSKHCNWHQVAPDVVVDAILEVAQRYGEAEVFVHGSVLRIEKPGTFSAKDYDDHAGSYSNRLTRNQVLGKLLSAYVLAVTDR